VITNEPLLQSRPDESQGLPELTPTEIDTASPTQSPWLKWADVVIAGGVWFLSVLCLLFVPLILVIPYLIYRMLTGGQVSAEMATDSTALFLSILGVIPAHAVTFLIVWLAVTKFRKLPFWKTIRFEWPESWGTTKGFVISALIAVVLLAIGLLVTKIFGGNKTQLDLLIESSTQARIATAVIAFATAPLIEELIYRGVLYSAIERVMGIPLAVAIVSFLFASVHFVQYYNNLAVVGVITLLSISLTCVRALTGKLLPSFIIHLVFNGIQSVVLLLQPLDAASKTPTTPGVHSLISLLHRLI
jgi:uncharacterized protein